MKKYIFFALILFAAIFLFKTCITSWTKKADDLSCLSVVKKEIVCLTDYSEVKFAIRNKCDRRIDSYEVVIKITDSTTGKKYYYSEKYRLGILAHEQLEQNIIIPRFDCESIILEISII